MQEWHDEYEYLNLLHKILNEGDKKMDRTGTGTLSIFGAQMRFDLSKGYFPLITTKKVHLKAIIHELLWFLAGDTNIKYLVNNNVNIWNADAYREYKKSGGVEDYNNFVEAAKLNGWDLGPIYGKQWRSWDIGDKWPHSIDQISDVIEQIKINPDSRRLIVSAWNPAEIPDMALPPCHVLFQFYVSSDNKLSCQLYQRSGDMFLGIPFNIASYALLTTMIASVTGLGLGEFVHTIGDAHIYLNHIDQVQLQLSRKPYPFPQMAINGEVTNIFDFKYEDFKLIGYNSHPAIKGDVSV